MISDEETFVLTKEIEREKKEFLRGEVALEIEKQNFAESLKNAWKTDENKIHTFTVERIDVMPWYKRLWCKFKSWFV